MLLDERTMTRIAKAKFTRMARNAKQLSMVGKV